MALTLLEIAAEGGRSFALIHFSGAGGLHTDVFRPGEYTTADKMAAAERFLGGGTDFKPPMREAVSLMENGGFERADVVFITDGECMLPDEFVEHGTVAELRAIVGIDMESIKKAVEEL